MARAKDDPQLNQIFDGPAGDREGTGPRDALRREVLEIVETAETDAPAVPLDDGLIAAYLDNALDADARAALEMQLSASHVLREQVAAAALAREAALESGLALPPAFAADYDAVPAPSVPTLGRDRRATSPGLIARLFGSPVSARRWLAASLPVLAVAVVVAVIGPEMLSDRAALQVEGDDGNTLSKPTPEAKAKPQRAEDRAQERPATGAKRLLPSQPVEAAKPKADLRRKVAPPPKVASRPVANQKRSGAAGNSAKAAKDAKAGKKTGRAAAVLNSAIVPLSSELRDAVVFLGRSQLGSNLTAPKTTEKKEAEKRSFRQAAPATGSRADKAAREQPADGAVAGMLSQPSANLMPRHIDVINKAVSPDCTKDPAACCGSHRVDKDLLNRLIAGRPPLQSVKVLHLTSRACYLTLP
ncbi:MAG: hypothetical protein OEQ29_21950 [Alphaproteobacteria bacterium]|nr:hypothetical protein [Alphaproteobacteria bacterium]